MTKRPPKHTKLIHERQNDQETTKLQGHTKHQQRDTNKKKHKTTTLQQKQQQED